MSKAKYADKKLRNNMVNIRLNNIENEQLMVLCDDLGMSKSEYLRLLIKLNYDRR